MIDIPNYLLDNKGPFLVCSRSVLREQVETLKGFGAEVFYSVKTNPEQKILNELHAMGLGFSVSNPDEFLSVVSMGVNPEKIIYYERGLTKERVKKLTQSGCRNFVVESEIAFKNLEPEIKKGFTVLARVKAEPASTKYAGTYSPGVGLEETRALMAKCKALGASTGVLHHSSSQVEDPAYWRRKFEFLSGIKGADIIDIGGGMPIDYNGESYENVLQEITVGIKRLGAKRIIAEPGRFIVGPACSLVTRVELVDGGNAVLNCSVYNVHIDTIVVGLVLPCRAMKGGKPDKTYRVLGSSLCNLDVFDPNAKLPELTEGEVVIFDKAGAYNFSSNFSSGSGVGTYIVD